MIFCGDIALPFVGAVTLRNFPDEIRKASWVGNLEGSLCLDEATRDLLEERKVFNHYDAINDLCHQINFKCFVIGNNHLLDAAPAETTTRNVRSLDVSSVGGGSCYKSASMPVFLGDYLLVSFGWEGNSCEPATSRGGVNSYDKWNVIKQAEILRNDYPDKKIICFMHWNYELELYPQPLDRELAHHLIDIGVYAVIGCHAHRVQPIEIYKDHPIVYGLGNFMFRQNAYMNGMLKFPSFSYNEIAFEITDDGLFGVHQFRYNPDGHIVTYIKKECVHNATFADMNEKDYKLFFINERVQKKLLPIFFFDDGKILYIIKIAVVKMRQKIINSIANNKGLFSFVKSLASKLS